MRCSAKIKEVKGDYKHTEITFLINSSDSDGVDKMLDKDLILDVSLFTDSRSLRANRYAWKLFDLIAKKLGSDKWTIYLLQLSKYGVFIDLLVKYEALERLTEQYRYTEILQEYDDSVEVRVYYGSSTYDTKEMSDLINGTVNDAHDLGIETLTDLEIKEMLKAWKGCSDGY